MRCMQLSESCLKSTLAFSSIAPLLCTVQLVCGTLARHRSLPKAMALRGGGNVSSELSLPDMPPIMYGTAWKKEQTEELVVEAVKQGFRGIDTACQPKHYYEPGVGAAVRRLEHELGISRRALFIQTKYTPLRGQDPLKVPYNSSASIGEQVQQSVEASLLNLQTTYLDSLVMHSPLDTHRSNMEAWRVFESFHKQGVARQLGLSNCYDLMVLKAIYEDAVVKPSVVQNRFYKDSDYDKELRAWCNAKGMRYQSFWTLTANPHLLSSPPFRAAAKRLDKTPEQIMYLFVAHLGITPLSGTKNVQHMKEDLEIFGGGSGAALALNPQEVAAMSKLI